MNPSKWTDGTLVHVKKHFQGVERSRNEPEESLGDFSFAQLPGLENKRFVVILGLCCT